MKVLSHLGIAIALASAGSMIAAPQSAMAQKEKKEKKKKGKKSKKDDAAPETAQLDLSPAYLEAYQTNNSLITAGNSELVVPGLPGLEALIANESDSYLHGSLLFNLGQKTNDTAFQVSGIERMLQNEKFLPAANKPIFLFVLGNIAFDNKENQKAIAQLNKAYDAGFRANNIELLLGYANNRENNSVEAIKWFERGIAAAKASGSQIDTKAFLGNITVAAIRSGDPALIDSTFKRILPQSADNALWHDGLAQLLRNSNYTEQENLDILRLMREKDALFFVTEYNEYAQAADARRLPNEVVTIVNSGVAKGHIPAGDVTFKEYLDVANGRMASDKADLPAAERDARSSANGRSARATADALLSYGEYQRAIDMYKLAIEKGDVDVDRARNRMGIAQVRMGDYDAAIANFNALTTPSRKNIGAYWAIYAQSKKDEATAPAAPPAS